MRICTCLVLLVAACTGIQATTIYAGPQRPIAGTCNLASRATLTRRGDVIILAPADGTLTLTGAVRGPAVTAQLTVTGADHTPYTLAFAGQIDGRNINGTLTTPRCRYDLNLNRTSD